MKKLLSILLVAVFFSSCSSYQKAIKSEDVAVKYAEAERQYDAGKYSKAIRLFEQLGTAYKGKPSAEKMFYMFAQSYYKTEQYYLAGYQFESFAASYPKSEKVEETSFLAAKSYSMLSPVYSIDQTDTHKGIDKLQGFIDRFPDSQYLAEANVLVKNLREKVEKKAYEIAKGYNTISDHKSAIKALDNFVIDYPGTPYKEAALYYKLDSAYKLAINSVASRMEERLLIAKNAYSGLVKFSPSGEYKEQADEMLARIENDLKHYSK
jgi:outer membrane protein assembly factor BamD